MRQLLLGSLLCCAVGALIACRFDTGGVTLADRASATDVRRAEGPSDLTAEPVTPPDIINPSDGPADVPKASDVPKVGDVPKIGDVPKTGDLPKIGDLSKIDKPPAVPDKAIDKPKVPDKAIDKPKVPDKAIDKPKIPDMYTPWPCSSACTGQKCCYNTSSQNWSCANPSIPDHCLCDPVSQQPCSGTHAKCIPCHGGNQCWQTNLTCN